MMYTGPHQSDVNPTTVRLTDDEKAAVEEGAEDRDCSKSDYLRHLVQEREKIADYDRIAAEYDRLERNYESLEADYEDLQSDYDWLKTQFERIQNEKEALIADYKETKELVRYHKAGWMTRTKRWLFGQGSD